MAMQYHKARKVLTVHPHQIALPYRGDGVAHALRDTYLPDADHIPADMMILLAAIDKPQVANDRG
jgi:hypothetical protein